MRRGRKILVLIFAVCLIAGSLLGCKDEPETQNFLDATFSESDEEVKLLTDRLLLAWSPTNMKDDFLIKFTLGFEDYCEEHEYQALVANSKNSKYEQYSAFENWIAMGADGIACSPVDVEILQPLFARAKVDGIIVAGVLESIESADHNYVIDDYSFGTLMGKNAATWIERKLGANANVVLVCSNENKLFPRENGLADAIEDVPGAKIVKKVNVGTREEARIAIETLLPLYNIDVIACTSDDFALGAAEAVDDSKLEDENFYIGGGGYTDEAIKVMNENGSYFRSSIDFDPYQAGRLIAETLAEYAVNGSLGETQYFGMSNYWQNILVW